MKRILTICFAMLAMAACKKEDKFKEMSEEAETIMYSRLLANKLNDSTIAFTNTDSRPLCIAGTYAYDQNGNAYDDKGKDTLGGFETINYSWSLNQGSSIKSVSTYFLFDGQYPNVTFTMGDYRKEF